MTASTICFFAAVSESHDAIPAQLAGAEHRAGPGAEILGGEVFAGNFVQVGVDVGRVDRLTFAIVVKVLEEFVTRDVPGTV